MFVDNIYFLTIRLERFKAYMV